MISKETKKQLEVIARSITKPVDVVMLDGSWCEVRPEEDDAPLSLYHKDDLSNPIGEVSIDKENARWNFTLYVSPGSFFNASPYMEDDKIKYWVAEN